MKAKGLPRALAIMGPTASGKTALAIELCLALDGEVISVDSGLVYRGMDIGTAKPSLEDRQGIPHHLIDILDPSEAFSTGQFRSQALALMDAVVARGRLPVLVGGTMLYFNALFNGLAELPSADPEIRRELDEEAARRGWHRLHEDLAKVDPEAAARIHPNDPQRIQRALEVYRIAGISLTELCRRGESPAPPFEIDRMIVAPSSREVLHERIAQRFRAMLAAGLIEEVERLFHRGDLDETLPSIRAVGYRQVWSYLKGENGYDEMIQRGVTATRQFAKRQYTWLRRQTAARSYVSEDDALASRMLKDLGRSR
ncbi:MAG: tRNA delta(2)-isopentenylpyrophosphate transferase [Proteobacteria bacterium]|nr:tRNA delta(2)-isopentenylpyrophosphate transferase [Pseudomonadota bacterium]